MLIVKYSLDEFGADEIYQAYKGFKKLYPDKEVVFVPKSWDLIEDAGIEALENIHSNLGELIEELKCKE